MSGWVRPRVDAPMPGPVPIRPMGLGEILDGGFKLLRADFVPMLLVIVVVIVPPSIIGAVLSVDVVSSLFELTETVNPDAPAQILGNLPLGSIVGLLAVSFLQYVLVLAAVAGVYRIATARYLGGAVPWTSALAGGFRDLPRVFAVQLGVGLAQLVAVALLGGIAVACFVGAAAVGEVAATVGLVLVGIFFVFGAVVVYVGIRVMTAFVVPAVVVERAGVVDAYRRSWRLVRARFWPVLGTLLLAVVVSGVIGNAFGGIPSFVGGLFPFEAWGRALAALGTALQAIITTPITALVTLMLYFDARIRVEGFDLEVRTGALGAAPGDDAGAGPET